MRDNHYFQKLEEAFAHCFTDEPRPLSDGEQREFDRSRLQATNDAAWRLHNPPQTDLFSRG